VLNLPLLVEEVSNFKTESLEGEKEDLEFLAMISEANLF